MFTLGLKIQALPVAGKAVDVGLADHCWSVRVAVVFC